MTERLEPGEWGNIKTNPVKREGRTGWRARGYVRTLDGVRLYRERTADTKKTAEKALTDLFGELLTPPPEPTVEAEVKAGDKPFGRYIDEWLENIADEDNHADGTLTEYKRTAGQIRKARVRDDDGNVVPGTLGELPTRDFTVALVRSHLRAIAATHRTKAKKHRTVLKQILDVAYGHDAVTKNPVPLARGIKRPKKKRVEAPTIKEALLLRKNVQTWQEKKEKAYTRGSKPTGVLLVLIDVIMATGLRIGEVLALRWHDIDLVNGTVTVRGTIIDGAIRQPKPKSKSGYRTLHLAPFAVTALKTHLEGQEKKPTQKVFPSRADTWRSKHNTHTMLRQFRADEGVSDDMTFRALRKTVATIIKEEKGARATMLQLGHSNESVQDAYVNRPVEAHDVADLLQAAFGKN